MSASDRAPEGGRRPANANAKVMLYVAPSVHKAMAQVALDEDRSTSSVYVEAAQAFLEARVKRAAPEHAAGVVPGASTVTELAEAIERQGRRIEELHAAIGLGRGAPPQGDRPPAGTKAAEAMRVILGIVRAAGAPGLSSLHLGAAIRAAGLVPGTAETAKAVLNGAGLVRFEGRRWYVDGA
ncbi:hypothetical protein [Methylobacterium pseudosasicola]|uniref:Uncharacterized protein n=1 Tax=Methylobacterium pseudosasicola TaxID=582667 RepID=A0A1I4PXM6_9HYPH|nr:hypothetical protein [Methylobacterium pseudosasicola]SFM32568.1 hypothetical protein SAMN05192568_102716 [Methylobacterium pseudosasicola]